MKIVPQMCLWTRKNCLNFESYPLLGGIRIWKFLTIFFSTLRDIHTFIRLMDIKKQKDRQKEIHETCLYYTQTHLVTVASLGLVSPGAETDGVAATDGVTIYFIEKN